MLASGNRGIFVFGGCPIVILRFSRRIHKYRGGYVYILANKKYGTLYIGETDDLVKRVWQHKNKQTASFTSKYKIDKLVYFEEHGIIIEAIRREKGLKRWKRYWKIKLIEEHNPEWEDLYEKII